MQTVIGLDLSWTAKYDHGICVLRDDRDGWRLARLEASSASVAELTALCDVDGEVVAAVDAPLVVHPDRHAERDFLRTFSAMGLGVHQTNYARLEKVGQMAGPELGQALAAAGFSLDPLLPPGSVNRRAVEVYPHAAHIRLFGLDRHLPYKRKKGRRVADLRIALAEYERLLLGWLAAHLPLVERDVAAALDPPPGDLRGKALKRREDILDAVTCAAVGWLVATAPDSWEVFGDTPTGHIVVPRAR